MGHWYTHVLLLGVLALNLGCDRGVGVDSPSDTVPLAPPVRKLDSSFPDSDVGDMSPVPERDGDDCWREPRWSVFHPRAAIDVHGEATVTYNVVRTAPCDVPPLPLSKPHHLRAVFGVQLGADPVELVPRDDDYQKVWVPGRAEAMHSGKTAVSLTSGGRAYVVVLSSSAAFQAVFRTDALHEILHAPPGLFGSIDTVLGPAGGTYVALTQQLRACVRFSARRMDRAHANETWVREDCDHLWKLDEVRHAFLMSDLGDFVMVERTGTTAAIALFGESHQPLVRTVVAGVTNISVIPWGDGALFGLAVTEYRDGDAYLEARVYHLRRERGEPSIELLGTKLDVVSRGIVRYNTTDGVVPVILLASKDGQKLTVLRLETGETGASADLLWVEISGGSSALQELTGFLAEAGVQCRFAHASLAKSAMRGVGAVVFRITCADNEVDRVFIQRFVIH